MRKTILIRADGSKSIGMGHLSRCCLIGNHFKKELNIDFILFTRRDILVERFLSNKSDRIIWIDSNISLKEELNTIENISKQENASLFILDDLEKDLNDKYMQSINLMRFAVLVITDDSFRRVIDANIVLNGNPNQQEFSYQNEKAEYLIGPQYFLMDSIYSSKSLPLYKNNPKKILITFGGSDHNNLIFKTLQSLEMHSSFFDKMEFLIIVSNTSAYLEKLQKHLENTTLKYELLCNVPSLAPYWEQCDLSLTAGGNTLFERIAANVPGATLCQLERQNEIANCFEFLGVNANLGLGPKVTIKVLGYKIIKFIKNKKLHEAMHRTSPNVIDGKGLERMTEVLIKKEYIL